MLNHRRIVGAIALAAAPVAAAVQTQPTSYTASWASVDQHPPAPDWFKDAKLGIYFHWGAFGTAAFGSEWYPRNMFNKGGNSAEYQHQLQVYGDASRTVSVQLPGHDPRDGDPAGSSVGDCDRTNASRISLSK